MKAKIRKQRARDALLKRTRRQLSKMESAGLVRRVWRDGVGYVFVPTLAKDLLVWGNAASYSYLPEPVRRLVDAGLMWRNMSMYGCWYVGLTWRGRRLLSAIAQNSAPEVAAALTGGAS